MEGLAEAGNGTAEFVKGAERLQPKVAWPLTPLHVPMMHVIWKLTLVCVGKVAELQVK